jgi:hypothetical protein
MITNEKDLPPEPCPICGKAGCAGHPKTDRFDGWDEVSQ